MNGGELIEAIREISELANTPIIMASASSFKERSRTKIINQSDGFSTKSIDIDRLLEMMGHCLSLEWIYDET